MNEDTLNLRIKGVVELVFDVVAPLSKDKSSEAIERRLRSLVASTLEFAAEEVRNADLGTVATLVTYDKDSVEDTVLAQAHAVVMGLRDSFVD